MIPRVKVNYGWRDLLAAVCTASERDGARLRETLSRLFAVEDVLLTPSGRGGLFFILNALPHSRVVIPAYTCKAVVEAARLAGKTVLFLDPPPDSFNCDTAGLAELLDADTVFVATHQFGIPCDIEASARICRERGALLVEDCAASLGTRIGGRLTGTFGDASFFSFDSTKLINVPLKAGFVLARTPELLARIRARYEAAIEPMPFLHQCRLLALGAAYLVLEHPWLYRLYHTLTLRRRFTADSPELDLTRTAFYRYDITPWQAHIAAAQLAALDAIIARRCTLHATYRKKLEGCHHLTLPPPDERGEWACIRFPILVADDKLSWYRAANARGVDFAFSFTYLASPPEYTRAHTIARTVLDLPYYHKLTDAELDRTVHTLRLIDETE
jgi:dTDP-4-amino-4,6-dideoxygalactose transaminase